MIPWIDIAKQDLGVHENAHGGPLPPRIAQLIHAGGFNERVPWCGLFLGDVMRQCGYQPPREYPAAKAWMNWGEDAGGPIRGAVAVVYVASTGGHHVTICTEVDHDRGIFLGLGGNQKQSVSIVAWRISAVAAWRLPPGYDPQPVTPEDLDEQGSRIAATGTAAKYVGSAVSVAATAATVAPLPSPPSSPVDQLSQAAQQVGTVKTLMQAVHDVMAFAAAHQKLAFVVGGVALVFLGFKLRDWRAETETKSRQRGLL